MIILLPKLLHASFWEWVLLSERFKEAVHGPLAVPLVRENLDVMRRDAPGLLGYAVRSIAHTDPYTVHIVFPALDCADEVALEAPADEDPLQQFPLEEIPGLIPSARFLGLLTSCLEAHAFGWLVPQLQARQHHYWSKSLAVCWGACAKWCK